MNCPKCGGNRTVDKDDHLECFFCGTRIEKPAPAPAPQDEENLIHIGGAHVTIHGDFVGRDKKVVIIKQG